MSQLLTILSLVLFVSGCVSYVLGGAAMVALVLHQASDPEGMRTFAFRHQVVGLLEIIAACAIHIAEWGE